MVKSVLQIEGMSCMHCVNAITKGLLALDGISGVEINLEAGTAAVEYDADKIAIEAINAAVEDLGYEVK